MEEGRHGGRRNRGRREKGRKWNRCKPIGEKRKKVKLKRKKDNRNGRRKDKTQKGR